MAEKEERILIKKQINYHPPYGGWCGDGKEIVLKRQEAIERMAKGLCAENLSHSCEDCMRNGTNDCFINEKEDFYKYLAEAALNALLEADK